MKHKFFVILFVFFSIISFSQRKPLTRILFVFDGSLSMTNKWQSSTRIDVAKNMLIHIIDSLRNNSNVQFALRCYGHQSYVPPQDCSDTRLEVAFKKDNEDEIIDFLNHLVPKGTTLIAKSLEYSANDFPPCSNCRNIVILITDGEEECDGDPCAVSIALQKENIILKPFIIGIDIDEKLKQNFDCVGNYFDAAQENQFGEILNVVISQALNNTTCQVNLLDKNGYPTETNVNMTFYDHRTAAIKYNFIHTMNHRGNPDTLTIDPLYTYDIVVHTLPPVRIDSCKLVVGKHTIFAVDAPQGYLSIKTGNNYHKSIKTIVRKAGTMPTINAQEINTTVKYLTGKYDVEILTLPRLYFNNINVKQSYTTKLQIPEPGQVAIMRKFEVYGSIYTLKDGKMQWVVNLSPNSTLDKIDLLPGNYIVIFRSRHGKDTLLSKRKDFTVKAGIKQTVVLN